MTSLDGTHGIALFMAPFMAIMPAFPRYSMYALISMYGIITSTIYVYLEQVRALIGSIV